MNKLFLIFLLPLSLYSSKILSYNIYERTDRVDVMITFDTPYDGIIKQSIGKSTITIKLEDATIESRKLKQLSSDYIRSLSITPMEGYTKIVASVPSSVIIKASKTSDAYGLRLRFTTKAEVIKKSSTTTKAENLPFGSLPTKKDTGMSKSYFIVTAILILGIIILLFIKNKVAPKNSKQKQTSSWLFKENLESQNEISQHSDDVSIRFQSSIDKENSVVMLDFGEQSYLVLMGKSNVLLDKFKENKPVTQDDFDTILQNRHKELDDFLHSNDGANSAIAKEPLQAYKERAASIAYEA
ncbi:hypothetical protein HUE87_07010 [Candidatus Sulfurimonas marisnigri]|uniref:Uncharacterized protein n=1 Tax=Candidatus Sulfurimonas marisnigri TaxID=2740405 RepID=A0A7S7LY98_9BACT|nr:hypothetical protein [Candidatus Sulfurimonas marisnigri]QOY53664.1 hypothetical protein HUE87_07010 [Candidatus Sulfurimonas marisnigri]